jgi:hypothetical protein
MVGEVQRAVFFGAAGCLGKLAGLDAGRHVIIPGFKAKLSYVCNRYLPDFVMNALFDRVVAAELEKMGVGDC